MSYLESFKLFELLISLLVLNTEILSLLLILFIFILTLGFLLVLSKSPMEFFFRVLFLLFPIFSKASSIIFNFNL